jgi:hypothetical protein
MPDMTSRRRHVKYSTWPISCARIAVVSRGLSVSSSAFEKRTAGRRNAGSATALASVDSGGPARQSAGGCAGEHAGEALGEPGRHRRGIQRPRAARPPQQAAVPALPGDEDDRDHGRPGSRAIGGQPRRERQQEPEAPETGGQPQHPPEIGAERPPLAEHDAAGWKPARGDGQDQHGKRERQRARLDRGARRGGHEHHLVRARSFRPPTLGECGITGRFAERAAAPRAIETGGDRDQKSDGQPCHVADLWWPWCGTVS